MLFARHLRTRAASLIWPTYCSTQTAARLRGSGHTSISGPCFRTLPTLGNAGSPTPMTTFVPTAWGGGGTLNSLMLLCSSNSPRFASGRRPRNGKLVRINKLPGHRERALLEIRGLHARVRNGAVPARPSKGSLSGVEIELSF